MAKSTTTRRSTTKRTTTKASTAKTTAAEVKPAAAAEVVKLVDVDAAPADTGETKAPGLRKRELIDRVVAASGMKKKDVKPVVEAALSVLGEALSKGEPMNLQPFGKLRVTQQKELPNGALVVARIRRSSQSVAADETPLAEPAE